MKGRVALGKALLASALFGIAIYGGGWFYWEYAKMSTWLSFSGMMSVLYGAVGFESFLFLALGFREYRKSQETPETVSTNETPLPLENKLCWLEAEMEKVKTRVSENEAILRLGKPKGVKN